MYGLPSIASSRLQCIHRTKNPNMCRIEEKAGWEGEVVHSGMQNAEYCEIRVNISPDLVPVFLPPSIPPALYPPPLSLWGMNNNCCFEISSLIFQSAEQRWGRSAWPRLRTHLFRGTAECTQTHRVLFAQLAWSREIRSPPEKGWV